MPFLYRASNPIQHWNDMNFHWNSIQLTTKKKYMIQYELFLNDPNTQLENIAKALNIRPQQKQYSIIQKRYLPAGERQVISNESFDLNYYQEKKYLEFYSPELLKFVNQQLDKHVMSLLKYKLIN